MRLRICLPVVALLLLCADAALSDVCVLKDGTRIEGLLLNPDESPRANYQLKLSDGQVKTIEVDDVGRYQADRPEKRWYRELLPRMPATADGNWKMAEWCRKSRLGKLRAFHLEEVVRLDPTHEKAHKALGHMRVDDQWVERDEVMQQRGFVRHNGRWVLPQELAILEQQDQESKTVKQWLQTVPMWRKWMDAPARADEAWANFAQITDPTATQALVKLLQGENPRNQRLRLLYIDVLSRLDHPSVGPLMIKLAMLDDDLEIREACLKKLPEDFHNTAVDTFVSALSSKENARVRRAAEGLKVLQEPAVVPQLIDSLVTTHRIKVGQDSPGQLGVSFGSASDGSTGGLGSFGVGSRAQVIERSIQNRSVLEALLAVTSGVNFRYDQSAWREWLVISTTPTNLDLRRRD